MMKLNNECIHSPFSFNSKQEEKDPSLLLQFILDALIDILKELESPYPLAQPFNPLPSSCFYALFYQNSSFERLKEHSQLLIEMFPSLSGATKQFSAFVEKIINTSYETLEELHSFPSVAMKKNKGLFPVTLCPPSITNATNQMVFYAIYSLYLSLEPCILTCNNNEHFFFFLIKNHKKLSLFPAPCNIYSLLTKMYGNNLPSAEKTMCKRFQKHGFHTMCSNIKKYIEEIEVLHE